MTINMVRHVVVGFSVLIISVTSIPQGSNEIPGVSKAPHPKINHPHTDNNDKDVSNEADGSHFLQSGAEKLLLSNGWNRLEVFCYKGESPNVANLLKTVELRVSVPNDNFRYYEGANTSTIKSMYKDSSWFTFSPWKPNSFRMNIYNYSCIGIETKETYRAILIIRHVDLWRVLFLSLGLFLFVTAPVFAHNIIFHYATGVCVGVCGSLLIVVFYISKFMPKKSGAMTVLIGGWGLVAYFVQYVWLNCLSMLKEYQSFVIGYVFVVGCLSFALVHRFGPLTDEKSISLVQWSLQLVSMAAIYFSCQYREFTFAIILILLANYNVPKSWKGRMKTYWLRYFPPKPRLLSDGEFLEQSRIETKKALDELREFCHSPDCNAWKTMSRLQSPQRFAEFVEGSSHLSDDEILSYENTNHRRCDMDDYLTSDEEGPADDMVPEKR